MEEKQLKTSVGQRVAIGIIAFFMLGSIIASYAAIIAGNSSSASNSTPALSEERLKYYESKYSEKLSKLKEVSMDDFNKFSPYVSEVKAYNETAANGDEVQIRDLLKGDGRKLGEKDGDYLAYYIGWCADETIFDSSFDKNTTSPEFFAKALDVSVGMIEGWYQGMQGTRLGGIREITIPGKLAYGEQSEICGGFNKPLRFLVMPVAAEDPLKTAASELDAAYMMLQYAGAGIDYEKEVSAQQNAQQTDQ